MNLELGTRIDNSRHGPSSNISFTSLLQGELGLNADYYLTIKDIANIRRSIDGLEWKFDGDQAQCLREFARANPELVLCYQEYDPDTSTPFFIGVTTSDLLDVAVRYGHGRPASIDSTFATNNLKARALCSLCRPFCPNKEAIICMHRKRGLLKNSTVQQMTWK